MNKPILVGLRLEPGWTPSSARLTESTWLAFEDCVFLPGALSEIPGKVRSLRVSGGRAEGAPSARVGVFEICDLRSVEGVAQLLGAIRETATLILMGLHLDEEAVAACASIRNLEELVINHCHFTGAAAFDRGLKKLVIDRCTGSIEIVAPGLEHLEVRGDFPGEYPDLAALDHLSIFEATSSDLQTFPTALAELRQLKSVVLPFKYKESTELREFIEARPEVWVWLGVKHHLYHRGADGVIENLPGYGSSRLLTERGEAPR